MSEQRDDRYAPPTTLPGLLQRGRGQGALIAAEDPASAADLVYGCIRWEWRWHRQIDDRALYLARLVRDLELPLGPIIELLAGDAYACARATQVLERLALGGSEEAREALRAYVRDGEHWVDVLESVAGRWPVAWWDDLEDVARARLEEGQDDPQPWALPWHRWEPAAPKRERPAEAREQMAEPAEMTSSELLELLADPGESFLRKAGALGRLIRREPEPGLVPLVPLLGTADGRYPALLRRAVRKLGPPARPAARGWVTSGMPWLARLGHEVLARHIEEQDVPTLLAALERDWVEQVWCGPMHTARGLARFGPKAADATSLLRRFWLWTPHSYERPGYLRALAAIDPAGLDGGYVESLWDCQSDARLWAVEHAPERPAVTARLAYLRDDPMEEPEVRNAAAVRLAGLTSGPLPQSEEAFEGRLE
ncbi:MULTISPECIES: hypothetical protein [unclassified Kitasatospora]|uniref:hypothetical protein n=1 Tax=unclassified Kitasatospora TaxID=2633591 RepID=UPI00340C2377